MTHSLKGKAAIVTGSTSGIGFGIAKALLKEGAKVIINGISDKEQSKQILDELSSFGVIHYCKADLSQVEEIHKLYEDATQEFGSIDIVVNNAGIQHVEPVAKFDPKMWQAILNINLSASFYLTQLCLANMEKKKWGRIVNIASVHGLVASINKAAYVAAKHGVVGLTKVIGLEYAGTGITCNAICPGWVLTPLVQAQIDKISKEKGLNNKDATEFLLSEKQPSLQFVTPENIGDLVLFLLSAAANQITGTVLPIDGGWTAR